MKNISNTPVEIPILQTGLSIFLTQGSSFRISLLKQGRDNLDPAQVMAVIIAISVVIENLVFGPVERRMRERRGLGLQRAY